jgi:ABC-2 type transport system permease protein
MSTTATAYASSTTNTGSLLAIYCKEAKYEFLKLLRARSFSLAIIGFPLMFYALFGLTNRHETQAGVYIAKCRTGCSRLRRRSQHITWHS